MQDWNDGPFIFWFVIDFKIGFKFVYFGGPGGPGGPHFPSNCGALRAPQFGRNAWPAVATGTPNIGEIKADFEICDKPNT